LFGSNENFKEVNFNLVLFYAAILFYAPQSPDLAICDFFLWRHLKQQVWNVPHEQQPRNLRQLRQAVILACQSLDAQMIQSAFSGMVNS
jgi:hypothetical protein